MYDPTAAYMKPLNSGKAEIEAGRRTPSSRWKVRFGLMLGLAAATSGSAATADSSTCTLTAVDRSDAGATRPRELPSSNG